MVLESILTGLQLVSGVTGILRSNGQARRDAELLSTLGRVEQLLFEIHSQTRNVQSVRVPLAVARSYARLIEVLKTSDPYRERLTFVPVGPGVWTVRRRTRRRQTILRDPRGEFGDSAR